MTEKNPAAAPLPDPETSIEELEAEGYRITDVLAGDREATPQTRIIIDQVAARRADTFHSDLLHYLTSERFAEPEARRLWQDILEHKYIVSEKLGRNVGVRVAALDYLENIKRLIEAPVIMDEDELRKRTAQAAADPLTGLFNRRKLAEELQRRVGGDKPGAPFTVLMLDLDGFKGLNDSLGHVAGDHVLQEFAAIMRAECPPEAVIARYGGDEMIIILDRVEKSRARAVGENIRRRVAATLRDTGVTVSLGLVEYPTDSRNYDQLLARLDEVLYRAKEFGGNRTAFYTPVEITYRGAADTDTVCAVGDFNRWNKNFGQMRRADSEPLWTIALNLKPGRYRYKLLLDGKKWIMDPRATESAPDGFGGQCSVITVGV